MEGAEKTKKSFNIRLMNDDLRMGKLKLLNSNTDDLKYEWDNLQWVDKADGTREPGTMINRTKIDHCSDSALYCWRAARHYLAKDKVYDPEMGTEEWYKQEAKNLFESAKKKSAAKLKQEQIKRKNNKNKNLRRY
jgi:hypothetical protein